MKSKAIHQVNYEERRRSHYEDLVEKRAERKDRFDKILRRQSNQTEGSSLNSSLGKDDRPSTSFKADLAEKSTKKRSCISKYLCFCFVRNDEDTQGSTARNPLQYEPPILPEGNGSDRLSANSTVSIKKSVAGLFSAIAIEGQEDRKGGNESSLLPNIYSDGHLIHKQPEPKDTPEHNILGLLRQGIVVIKHGGSGRPKQRFIQVDEDCKYFFWGDPPKPGKMFERKKDRSFAIGDIVRVREGVDDDREKKGKKGTHNLRRSIKTIDGMRLCFSIFLPDRTFDIQCLDEHEYDILFMKGLLPLARLASAYYKQKSILAAFFRNPFDMFPNVQLVGVSAWQLPSAVEEDNDSEESISWVDEVLLRMGVPKSKVSPSRKRMKHKQHIPRRTDWVQCEKCGEPTRKHRLCTKNIDICALRPEEWKKVKEERAIQAQNHTEM